MTNIQSILTFSYFLICVRQFSLKSYLQNNPESDVWTDITETDWKKKLQKEIL